jgi:hypothetical protein
MRIWSYAGSVTASLRSSSAPSQCDCGITPGAVRAGWRACTQATDVRVHGIAGLSGEISQRFATSPVDDDVLQRVLPTLKLEDVFYDGSDGVHRR